MSPGTLGGQSRVATPSAPAVRRVVMQNVPSVTPYVPPPEFILPAITLIDNGNPGFVAGREGRLLLTDEGQLFYGRSTPPSVDTLFVSRDAPESGIYDDRFAGTTEPIYVWDGQGSILDDDDGRVRTYLVSSVETVDAIPDAWTVVMSELWDGFGVNYEAAYIPYTFPFEVPYDVAIEDTHGWTGYGYVLIQTTNTMRIWRWDRAEEIGAVAELVHSVVTGGYGSGIAVGNGRLWMSGWDGTNDVPRVWAYDTSTWEEVVSCDLSALPYSVEGEAHSPAVWGDWCIVTSFATPSIIGVYGPTGVAYDLSPNTTVDGIPFSTWITDHDNSLHGRWGAALDVRGDRILAVTSGSAGLEHFAVGTIT